MTILAFTLVVFEIILAITFSIIVISRQKRNPAASWAWIFTFFILPYFGVLIYLVVGIRSIRRQKKISRAVVNKKYKNQIYKNSADNNDSQSSPYQQIFNLGENLCGLGLVGGNAITLFENNGETFRALENAILEAKHHVHLEYYIFKTDEIGQRFKMLLIQKQREGVCCRLLIDHVGSFGVKKPFIQDLRLAGVQCAFFMPLKITRPWGFQLRNHRKLAIIDGNIGFIGSQNIGNEYTKRKSRQVSWRDAVIKIEGPAVHHLQTIFLEDWLLTTTEKLHHHEFFSKTTLGGNAAIQVIPTGPNENDYALEVMICDLIHHAQKHITITTPYLVPTLPILVALEAAVKKGVLVEILIPTRSDHFIVDQVARSWYRDLTSIGVRLFSYEETFIHAKVITIDDDLTFIGSANIDERSFRLNFECSTIIIDTVLTTKYKTNFKNLIMTCETINNTLCCRQSFDNSLKCGLFRLISPLL